MGVSSFWISSAPRRKAFHCSPSRLATSGASRRRSVSPLPNWSGSQRGACATEPPHVVGANGDHRQPCSRAVRARRIPRPRRNCTTPRDGERDVRFQKEKWFALTERRDGWRHPLCGQSLSERTRTRVLAAGYEIEAARNDHGVVEGFEIAGVSAEDRAIASKRRAQIEKEIAVFRKKHGREPTTREIHGIRRGPAAANSPKSPPPKFAAGSADFPPERALAMDELVRAARRVADRPLQMPGRSARAPAGARSPVRASRRPTRPRSHRRSAQPKSRPLGLEPLKQTLTDGLATDCVALKPDEHGLFADYATREDCGNSPPSKS